MNEITDQTPGLDLPSRSRQRLEHAPEPGGHPMEIWISYTLRVGVLIAGAIIAVGLALLIVRGPGAGDPRSLHDLQARGDTPINVSLPGILRGALRLHPTNVIELGVLALILTPVVRVAMTLVLFVVERDHAFIAITSIVLAILIVGLIGIGS
jgi:uncharacterized membrane protein